MVGKDAIELFCSFCDRSQRDVAKLIAGPGVYICDGCVALAAVRIETSRAAGGPVVSPLRETPS